VPLPPNVKPSHPPIRILTHPVPVRVSYSTVHELVPKLWAQYPRIDYMIHIGMAAGREFYSVERRGHRDGYNLRDVDGRWLRDYGLEKEWEEEGCPEELKSDVDIDAVWRYWKKSLPVSLLILYCIGTC
jgi:pyroglutamyl-peptidase